MLASDLLLLLVFSEGMVQSPGKWVKDCDQRKMEFLGYTAARHLERRTIGHWVRPLGLPFGRFLPNLPVGLKIDTWKI
jgi:hypothetical protein